MIAPIHNYAANNDVGSNLLAPHRHLPEHATDQLAHLPRHHRHVATARRTSTQRLYVLVDHIHIE